MFPIWETCYSSHMKLVGRRLLLEFDGSHLAKRRLSLWAREVAASTWRSVDDLRAHHPDISELNENAVRLNFFKAGVFVEVAFSFPAAVVCVEKVGATLAT
jgi:hypothetical protein